VASKRGDSLTGPAPVWLKQGSEGVSLSLYVQPGARRTAVVGLHGERLKIAVASPPVEGRANEALLEFLSSRLRLRRSALTLASGASSREKRIVIAAPIDVAALVATLSS
jgi:uncharacterized protein (TIGR00251 family)